MNTEQERAELLPCPFCGETEGLIIQHCEGTIIHPALRIYCDNCGASSGYSDRVDPVANWNRRAALQSQDMRTVIEALETAQNNECGSRRPWGSADPDSDEYDHDAFMWDYYQRAINHARRIEGDGNKCS